MGAGCAKNPVTRPLEGENIETEHWEHAPHWMSIYDDLIRFKLGLLDRLKRELPKVHPAAESISHRGEMCDGEQSTAGYHSGELHHQAKTFAESQRTLIQNELVGVAAGRARVHAERGEPDALTRFRDSGNDADR
jgi:hypothetical protein